MSRVLLCQLDGKIPNLALMRIAAHHRSRGDEVELRHGATFLARLFDSEPDVVYGSAIFRSSIPLAEQLRKRFPSAIIGGTGVDPARKGEAVTLSPVISPRITAIEDHGFSSDEAARNLDYSLWPESYVASLGMTQRGCRLACEFCCVRAKEGPVRSTQSVWDVWRGAPYPRHLHLLDNDFFGQSEWRQRVAEIRDGKFTVSFNQGINARFLDDEAAEAIASIDYRDDSMKVKRIYTAWDNLKDEKRLFDGLRRLVRYGVKPDHIMVYVLIGYWHGETAEQNVYRIEKLLDFGARPYPMPFVRTRELVGMQRWAMGAYAKHIPWHEWVSANYEPRNLNPEIQTFPLFEEAS